MKKRTPKRDRDFDGAIYRAGGRIGFNNKLGTFKAWWYIAEKTALVYISSLFEFHCPACGAKTPMRLTLYPKTDAVKPGAELFQTSMTDAAPPEPLEAAGVEEDFLS